MKYLKADINQPLKASVCGEFTSDENWTHMERILPDYEIIIVNKGVIFMEQDGQKYTLSKGDVFLVEPHIVHKGFKVSPEGTNFYWMHFSCSGREEIINSPQALKDLTLLKNNPYFEGLNSHILIPKFAENLDLVKVYVLFHQLLHVSYSNYYSSQSINYILTSILIELTEQVILSQTSCKTNSSDDSRLSIMLQWINNHIKQNISLKDVAYEFNLSREYLTRYFKKNMGMCMQDYINTLRITNAKQLLCTTNSTIKDISKSLGFVDEKYFHKLFKKYENLTPKEYRKAYSRTFINNQ